MALWTPQDEPGLIGWWDMSNPSSYNTGTKTWTPRYGYGSFVAPGDGPSVITNGLGASYNALQFSGASDTSLVNPTPGFNEAVLVLVLRLDTAENITATDHDFGDERYIFFSFGGGRVEYLDQSTDYYDGGAWPRNVMVVARQARNNRLQRWNGTEVVDEGTVASGTDIPIEQVFRLFPNNGTTYTAQVAAVGLFYDYAYSDALAEQIEGFLAHNSLGVETTALPGGHTYKTTAPMTVGDPELDMEATQTLADFTQTGVVSSVVEMGAYQVMEDIVPLMWGEEPLEWDGEPLGWGTTDFIQTATLGDGLAATADQVLADFPQIATMEPAVMLPVLSATAEQVMDDFIQSVRLGRFVDAVPHPGFPTRSVGPGIPGIPIRNERPVTMEYYRLWPTK